MNHSSRTAIYLQIATQMKAQILNGEIAAGSSLPSERAMAQRLGVHRNTVIKAYAELKAEELIVSQQGGRICGRSAAECTELWKKSEESSLGKPD